MNLQTLLFLSLPPMSTLPAPPKLSAGGNLESGNATSRPPKMTECPTLRWAFARKVYTILLIQLLLTVAAAVALSHVTSVPAFFFGSNSGIALYVLMLVFPLILLCPMYAYRKHHPVNLVLLTMFTLTIAFTVGLACSFSKGKVVLLAGILTSVVTIGLTMYAFWAVKKGYDFQFLLPFLLTSLLVLITYAVIQIYFPMGKLGSTIYGCIAAIVFSAFIIFDTDNLIKKYDYDDYIWAAVALYLDIINLFLAMVGLIGADCGGDGNVFTVAIAFTLGLPSSFVEGNVLLHAGILTSVTVVTLTIYTFCAAACGGLWFRTYSAFPLLVSQTSTLSV